MESKRDRRSRDDEKKISSLITDIKYLKKLGLSGDEIIESMSSQYRGDCTYKDKHLKEAFKRSGLL